MSKKVHFCPKSLQFSLFGGKINITVFSVIAVFTLLYADLSVYTLIIFSTIFIHELSHIIHLKCFGASIKKINVYPFGIDIISDMQRLPYSKELTVMLSGGMANLLFALITSVIFTASHSIPVCFFIYANLVFGIGNLIPVPCFDGGRALHITIDRFFLPDKAYLLQKWADITAYWVLLLLGILLMSFTSCNLSVIISFSYCILAAICFDRLSASNQIRPL